MFQQFDAFAPQFVAAAPPEIRPDTQTVVNALTQREAAYQDANFDVCKIRLADVTALQESRFVEATKRIDAYDSQVCGMTWATT